MVINSIVEIKILEKDRKFILQLSGINEKHVTRVYDLLLTDFNEIQNSIYRLIITQNFLKSKEPFTLETDILPVGNILYINGIIKPQSNVEKFHKLIRDYLHYGDRKKVINFTSCWVEKSETDEIIKAKIFDPLTKEDMEKTNEIIKKMLENSDFNEN